MGNKLSPRSKQSVVEVFSREGQKDLWICGDSGKNSTVSVSNALRGHRVAVLFATRSAPSSQELVLRLITEHRAHSASRADDPFAVVLVCCDETAQDFHALASTVPFLAVPFGDPRLPGLRTFFRPGGVPWLVMVYLSEERSHR